MTTEEVNRAVDAFAADMRAALLKPENMAKKPQYPDMPSGPLSACCEWKAGLVTRTIHSCGPAEIMKQAVDLANYAMMLYDNARRRELRERK